MGKRFVIFTQRVEVIEAYRERRDCIDQRVTEFIFDCGYVPVALPNHPGRVCEMVTEICPAGLVLTGGNDLVKYGGDAPERDEAERLLLDLAIAQCIPLYGFCRGMQLILDYFGNGLCAVDGHVAVHHTVTGEGGGLSVNSFHKLGCVDLTSDELEIRFRAENGVIEMVSHKSLPIIGTMWHPERECPFEDRDIAMVRRLFGGEK